MCRGGASFLSGNPPAGNQRILGRYPREGGKRNSEMGNREIRHFCRLGDQEEAFLQMVFQRLGLSARGCQKLLRVARTIADLDGQEQIQKHHLIEAVGYRDLEERYWGREES